jgi:hypothetical protein
MGQHQLGPSEKVHAKFDLTEHDQLILDEENEVSEMYFIQEGIVGIGYYLMT